jgi:hypothetical protein
VRFPDQHRALAKGAGPRPVLQGQIKENLIAAEIAMFAEDVAVGVQA